MKRVELPERRFAPGALFASWFGAGYLPGAPGTWGSLAALPFAWAIATQFGSSGLAVAATLVFFLGWAVSAKLVRQGAVQDPQWIVVDEVAGQWLTLSFASSSPIHDPLAWIVGFITFRLADMIKPFPASWADREVGGGLGVMLDDIFAVIYSAAATWATHRFLGGGVR